MIHHQCKCWTCKKLRDPKSEFMEFTVCEICGNKRCPHGTHHKYKCTNSNEPGQTGSRY